ncbi:MAG TPA: hypothetical protein VEJ23_04890 [Solirubrobacteraceae bacterium]|nr:hypothetical protein [Solirubrobacteraceae bacterium]
MRADGHGTYNLRLRPASDNSPEPARSPAPGRSRGPLDPTGPLAGALAFVGVAATLAGLGSFAAGTPPAAAQSARAGLVACAAAPSWLSVGTLPDGSGGPLSACFARSSEAEAPLELSNDGARALLLAVTGPVELDEYWFSGRVDAALATSLQGVGSGGDEQVVVIGPHRRTTLTIGRPPPAGERQEIGIATARGPAGALAAVGWTFLHDAREHAPIPAGVERCVASTLLGVGLVAARAQHALSPMRQCVQDAVDHAPGAASAIRADASRLLSDAALAGAARSGRGVPEVSPIDLAIAGSPPGPVNPDIRIALPDLSSVFDGTRTVSRLSASGGTAPYRFYVWQEPGGAPVPSWVRLAPRGTLAIAPPAGASLSVKLTIYAVDADGYYSQDLP